MIRSYEEGMATPRRAYPGGSRDSARFRSLIASSAKARKPPAQGRWGVIQYLVFKLSITT